MIYACSDGLKHTGCEYPRDFLRPEDGHVLTTECREQFGDFEYRWAVAPDAYLTCLRCAVTP